MKDNRENFGNRLGVLFALAGSAIGLGNMWRFPYLVGQNGGAAFILIYLLLLFFICLPVMISEFLIGRRTHANAFRAFRQLNGKRTGWDIIGIFAVLAAVCILSFYCVVGGWTVKYFIQSCLMTFNTPDMDYSDYFGGFISSAYQPLFYTFIFLGMTGGIIALGVRNGIEKFSKVMMTVLFILIVLIAIRSLTLPGATEGIKYLFIPDFSKVDGHTVVAALGQAFFSISIGCGTILTYGSYVKNSENIALTSTYTALMDTLFALVAGIAIIPAVYAIAYMNGYAPEINAGPGLVFITLPGVFKAMPLGSLVAIIFFLSLMLAALTSSISQMESFVAYLIEEVGISRKKAALTSFALSIVLGTFCSLSQGVLSGVHLFGRNIFDFFDAVSSNVLMTFGGLLMVIFAGWRMKKSDYLDELTNHGTARMPRWITTLIYFLVRFVAPLGIIAIIVSNLLS